MIIYMISAFVLVNCHFPFDTTIIDELSKMPSITSVYRTEGRYELLLKVSAETKEKLTEVTFDIGKVPGIDTTLSLIIAQ